MTIRDMKARAEGKANVTAPELALLLGVSVDTVRRHGKSGRIPELRMGRCVRYPREECIAKLRERVSEMA